VSIYLKTQFVNATLLDRNGCIPFYVANYSRGVPILLGEKNTIHIYLDDPSRGFSQAKNTYIVCTGSEPEREFDIVAVAVKHKINFSVGHGTIGVIKWRA
jgi:hypothetical protein